MPDIYETPKTALTGEGKDCKDLQVTYECHTQNKSLKKIYTRKAAARKQRNVIFICDHRGGQHSEVAVLIFT
jgi:hypothetical protein